MRRAYVVSGHVQGVGFRWWTRDLARRLGVSGWVRNEGDGTVRLEVSGDPARVEALVHRLSDGPPGARVERIREAEPGPELHYEGFSIME